jgi:AcrR family transcriptional regulator
MPKVSEGYREARTAEILSAAAACFARAGYRGTSMADIAEQAGLSAGALYRYFESKEVLFQALTRMARKSNEALWAEIAAQEEPSAQLDAFVGKYFDMVADPRCRPSLALDIRLRSEALDSDLVRGELQAAYRVQIANIARRLKLARGTGTKVAAAETAARVLIGLLNEAGLQALLVPGFDATTYRRRILQFIRAWTDGD